MPIIKNTSTEPQAFTGYPIFQPAEEREVDIDTAEYLSHSPHMSLVIVSGTPSEAIAPEETKDITDPYRRRK